ncbi:uncharacterized protein PAC_06750 [Phialocephala subalpina]|uniref:Inositolphosphotransferase Aur1/Ipt1 domain-containing protein n=1 Tax=Phialocephala subalpina TaxID=576137 RepID=A0A1L7WVR4_9HELO|nr:uncharacterized protein PAC_06750 [Phialocephala subalpina]
MGIKNVVEPLGIVLIFTVATLANRTRRKGSRYEAIRESESDIPNANTPLIERPPILHFPQNSRIERWLPHPDNSGLHGTLLSRFFRKFPFLLEIWYWALTYWPYQLLRARTAVWINRDPVRKAATFDFAKRNAIRVLDIEKWLGIDIEHSVQQFVLTRCKSWVMTLLCDVYVAHITVGVAFLGYAYTYFPREKYQRLRRTIFLNNFLAFFVLTLYRCTPPRLMPSSYHFVDVLHPSLTQPGTSPPSDWANNRFQLTIAAMPSLHFGTALLIGCSIAMWGRHAWLRALGYLYPGIMAIVVISTANHWVLDCVAGAMVVGLGWLLNWVVLVFRPAEEWLFWLLRAEKPRDNGEVMVPVMKQDDDE